eukprot:INCI15901.1.p1 GENE.INCI15901.1~~INCI15901.1.p1  ORF type:complete len:505 (-),score=66.71 INCI15901.1:110-1624(-)
MQVATNHWPSALSTPSWGDRAPQPMQSESNPMSATANEDPFAGGAFGQGADPFSGNPFAAAPSKRKVDNPTLQPSGDAGAVKRSRQEVNAQVPLFGQENPQAFENPAAFGVSSDSRGQNPFSLSASDFAPPVQGGAHSSSRRALAAGSATDSAALGRTKRRLREVSCSRPAGGSFPGASQSAGFEDMPPVHRIRMEQQKSQKSHAGVFGRCPQKRRGAEAFGHGAGAPFAKVRSLDAFGNPMFVEPEHCGPMPVNSTCTDLIVHPHFGGGRQQLNAQQAFQQLPRTIGPSGNCWGTGLPIADLDDDDDAVQIHSVWETHAGREPPRRKQPLLLCDAKPGPFDDFFAKQEKATAANASACRGDRAASQDCNGDVSVWGARTIPERPGPNNGAAQSSQEFPWSWGVPVSPRERRKFFQDQQRLQQQQQQRPAWLFQTQAASHGPQQQSFGSTPPSQWQNSGASRKRRNCPAFTSEAASIPPPASAVRTHQPQHSVSGFSQDVFGCD